MRVEDDAQIADAGKRTFAIVHSALRMLVGDREVTAKGYLLGVSGDRGHTWKFIDGAGVTPDLLAELYPDFPATLKLPEKEAARE